MGEFLDEERKQEKVVVKAKMGDLILELTLVISAHSLIFFLSLNTLGQI